MPPASDEGRPPREADPQQDAAGSRDDRTAQDQLQVTRQKMQNTMNLAACIVCNDASVRLLRIIAVTGRTSRQAHSFQVTECATQSGCMRWWSAMAVGEWVSSATPLVVLLSDAAALSEMGFACQPLDESSVDGIVEQRISDSMHRLVVELLAMEVKDMSYWSSSLPGKFGGLIHKDSGMQEETIDYLNDLAVALEALEAAMPESSCLQDFWCNLHWSGQLWCKEILLAIREADGENLPDFSLEELRKVGRCMKSTKDVENMFNDLRSVEHLQSANKMGRPTRLYRCMASRVQQECDRAPVEILPEDRTNAASQLAPQTFQTDGSDFSLGQAVLQRYLGPRSWASPKPDFLYRVAMMTETLLQKQGELHQLEMTWLSLLAEKGTLIVKAAGPVIMGLVLDASPYGVYYWKCDLHKSADNQHRWWTLDATAAPYGQLVITDIAGIKATEVTLQPPALSWAGGWVDAAGARPAGLILVAKGQPLDLLPFAARHGFHNMSMQHLRDLVHAVPLEVSKPLPKNEHGLASACILAGSPGCTEQEAEELAKHFRGTTPVQATWAIVLDSAGLAYAEGILDNDDAAAIRKHVHTKEVQRAVEEGKRQALQKGPRKPRKLTNVLAWASFTRDQAQQFCPPIKGCRVDKDERLHFRWKIAYPCDSAPFSCTKVWHASTSQRESLLHCLSWAWRKHAEATGEACSYKLEEEI